MTLRVGQRVLVRAASMLPAGYQDSPGVVDAVHEDRRVNVVRNDGRPLAYGQAECGPDPDRRFGVIPVESDAPEPDGCMCYVGTGLCPIHGIE